MFQRHSQEQAGEGASVGVVRVGSTRTLSRRRGGATGTDPGGSRRKEKSGAYKATLDALMVATMVPEDERCFLTVQKVGIGFLVSARFPHAELMKVASKGAGYVQYGLHTGGGYAHLSFSVVANELEPEHLEAFKVVAR